MHFPPQILLHNEEKKGKGQWLLEYSISSREKRSGIGVGGEDKQVSIDLKSPHLNPFYGLIY
jgi:hypothetical protein